MQGFIDFLLHRRYFLALLSLLAGAAICWGSFYTTTDSTFTSILSEDDPYRAQVDEVAANFPPSNSAMYVFLAEDGDIFDFETLAAMEDLHARYIEVDSALSAGSLINQRLNAVDAELYDRDYLIPELSLLEAGDLALIRRIALADEDLTKTLLSPAGDMTLAVVKYRTAEDNRESRLRVSQSVVDLRDALREDHPGVTIYAIGRDLFELDGHKAQVKDRAQLFPLVGLAIVVLLWYCLGSLAFTLCILAVAYGAVMLTTGTMGWSGNAFNQISNMGPMVVLTIAMADGIHLVSVYLQGLHKSLDKVEALRESLRVNFQPVTLATITTAMGFLSLNYCSSPGIYGFGNVVAMGAVWAFLMTFTLLPTLMLLVPVRKIPSPLGVRRLMNAVSTLVAQRGNLLIWSSMVVIVATLAMLPLNRIDFNRYSFVDKDSDFHKAISALAEKIGNDQSLVYSIDSDTYYGITEPAFLAEVEKFVLWLETQPEASFVNSYISFLKTLNKSEHDNDQAWYRIPEDKLQVIDHLVTYQLVQEIEPHLEPIFDPEYSAIRLVVGTSRLSNLELLEFNDRIEQWISANLNSEYRVLHGDNSILGARMERSISVQLLQGFSLSFVLITLTLIIGLRSLRYGLLSIGPNLFPATIVFGVWGLLVGELSPYILMLFSISIGLVVDDSVHVLSKYSWARHRGDVPEAAVQYSLDRAGSAITITTAALAVGTFILVFSSTFYFQNVALMLTPIIVVALLLDLLFLPPLLVRFDNWIEGRGS
jgi:predicted RND superfamily exporter protein